MRERELKRADKAAAYANTLSLPMRERELKLRLGAVGLVVVHVAPMRERELKQAAGRGEIQPGAGRSPCGSAN